MRYNSFPRLISVGTANPSSLYTQEDVLTWSQEADPKIQKLFRNSHIETRDLYLPEGGAISPGEEGQHEMIDRHIKGDLEIGTMSIQK